MVRLLPRFFIEIDLIVEQGGWTITDVGTDWVEMAAIQRVSIDFSRVPASKARLIVSARGNETGAGKGVQIWNATDGEELCSVVWDGDGMYRGADSPPPWTPINLSGEKQLQVRFKGSSATEDLTIYYVRLQLAI